MHSRLLVIPAVSDIESFATLLGFLGHYFAHVGCERIAIPVDRRLVGAAEDWLADPKLPIAFGDRTLNRIEDVRSKVKLRPWPSNLEPPALTSDVVLDWNVERSERAPWAQIKSKYRTNRTLFVVDWDNVRMGSSWIAEAAKVLSQGRRFKPVGAEHLQELIRIQGQLDKAYLVGTGPSAREALNHDFRDGVRIVCNTIVLDDELMDHIRPHVVTFADPIFHFGPSTYAQEFQRRLLAQADRHDFLVVTTERFAPLLSAHIPDLSGRVVGVRQGHSTFPDNLDLGRHQVVRPYPNILTMLMLPIAGSLAHRVDLVGFDGRSENETYFWRHGSTVQLQYELEDIRRVHPGFFDLDYQDYYDKHLAQLEWVIRRLELRGVEVVSLTSSFMEPLRRRTPAAPVRRPSDKRTGRPTVVSVTPDWIDHFGHFGPFERRLHEVAHSAGMDHVALASSGIDSHEEWIIPLFTGFEMSVGRGGGRFETELSMALEALDPQPNSVVALYAGNVWHVPPILRVARQHPETRFIVNLMRAHDWIRSVLQDDNPWSSSLLALLDDCATAAVGTNVDIAVDTEKLASDLEMLLGRRFPIWPMVAVSSFVDSSEGSRTDELTTHIVSPVHPLIRKGIKDVASLARSVAPLLESGAWRLSVRHAPQPTPVSKEVESVLADLESSGATLVGGDLTDEEFARLLLSADVVLVPYSLRPFRTRTSGVVLDAILAGKPVVTVRGTWAGDLVESLGVGVTYVESDVRELRSVLDDVITHLDSYRSHVSSVRDEVARRFAPDRLIEFFVSRTGMPSVAPDSTAVDAMNARSNRLRDLFVWRTIIWDRHAVEQAVAHDDRDRMIDEMRDKVELLEGAIEWRRSARAITAAQPPTSRVFPEFPREAKAHLDEVGLVASMVDPDGTLPGLMVDVGAHRGSALRHFLARDWAIRAYEPDARHFAYLRETYGNDERVTIDPRAVTDRSGQKLPLYTSDESSGVTGLHPFLESHTEADRVETVTLSDSLDGLHVDVLKIDTEGYDLPVLRGFDWSHDRPDIVICEFEDRKTTELGYSTLEMGEFLESRGYQVWVSEWHPIVKYGIKHDWHRMVEFDASNLRTEAWGNLIAFKTPVDEDMMAAVVADHVKVENPVAADNVPVETPATADNVEVENSVTTDSRSNEVDAAREMPAVANTRGPMPTRRQALKRALHRPFGIALGMTIVFVVLALGLVGVGESDLALVAGLGGIASLGLGSLVVAVRLERRAR